MAKETKSEHKRDTRYITLSHEANEFLKNNVTNASRFIDELIKGVEKGILAAIVAVSPIASGLVEIRTRDLRRVKATS